MREGAINDVVKVLAAAITSRVISPSSLSLIAWIGSINQSIYASFRTINIDQVEEIRVYLLSRNPEKMVVSFTAKRPLRCAFEPKY